MIKYNAYIRQNGALFYNKNAYWVVLGLGFYNYRGMSATAPIKGMPFLTHQYFFVVVFIVTTYFCMETL